MPDLLGRRLLHRWTAWTLIIVAVLVCCLPAGAAQDPLRCGLCGKPFGTVYYPVIDKVKHEKVFLCYDCAICPDECYICGLPAGPKALALADGRFLCARDAKTVVLDAAKAVEMCEQIRDTLDRKFSRFMSLPSTNVTVNLVDRVNLYDDDLTVKGNDFECPDILGYIQSRTNAGGGMVHSISIMSALPLAGFYATCAHEYGHAWIFENVSSQRRKTIDRDSVEGFCELLAYLLVESMNEQEQMSKMLRNTYTRGQIDVFIAVEKEFGLNDVLDWMRWGVNPRLKAGALGDIRNVEMPRAAKPASATNAVIYGAVKQPAAPSSLVLKGISSGGSRPLAMINDQTLAVGESAKVRVGTTNVTVRCLEISERSVRIQMVDSGSVTNLQLSSSGSR